MHCVICDHFENPDDPRTLWNKVVIDKVTRKPTCLDCQQSIDAEQKNIKNENGEIAHIRIEQALAELERRIPGLFYGPYCPGNCLCRCVTKCKLLLDDPHSAGHNIDEGESRMMDGFTEQGII